MAETPQKTESELLQDILDKIRKPTAVGVEPQARDCPSKATCRFAPQLAFGGSPCGACRRLAKADFYMALETAP